LDVILRIPLQEAGRFRLLLLYADYKGKHTITFTMDNLPFGMVLRGFTRSLYWSGRGRRAAGAVRELRALEMASRTCFRFGRLLVFLVVPVGCEIERVIATVQSPAAEAGTHP
jgi:hypothetical protein